MDAQIAQFGDLELIIRCYYYFIVWINPYSKYAKSKELENDRWWGEQRVVDMIGHIKGEAPVISAILEQVP